MKKIKLLHFQLCAILSGVQNMMLQLLSALPQEKYDIYVVSRSDGQLPEKVKEYGWTHIPLDSIVQPLSLTDIISTFKFYSIIKRIKPDIVHTHSSKPGFIGRIVARLAGTSLVIHTIDGFPFHAPQGKLIWKFYEVLETFAGRFAHLNVSVNKYERDYAIQKLSFPPEKVITIYNGITVSSYEKRYDDDYFTHNKLRVVSVSRFTMAKNLLATFPKLIAIVKKYPQVSFTFYGDGELFSQCKAMVEDSQTSEQIILKGWVETPQRLLTDYDAFFLNSLWEGLSISILEAMSIGLPIICSDIKGNNELVDNTNGWLVDATDDISIEKIIIEILSDMSCLQIKGNASRQKVIEQFSLQATVQAYREVYESGEWKSPFP